MAKMVDSRFTQNDGFEVNTTAGPSKSIFEAIVSGSGSFPETDEGHTSEQDSGLVDGMDPDSFAGPVVKPLTPEALAAFKSAQKQGGVIYISRIPPGMQPAKVRHLMSQYGEVGRVYLQKEDAKRAYLRRKYTATKKPHYTEGWVEFKDKKVARSVAEILNAQTIGGKKGTRWRDDVWTLKYLPKFKWHMLTEQVAHEAAIHTAQLHLELSQSKLEQREYLKNVELARVLDKREERSYATGKEFKRKDINKRRAKDDELKESESEGESKSKSKRPRRVLLESVLDSIF
ncbi:hypothetical protein B0F90DRAFT_1715832 [Multifurca ochricompacta]|uniref:18S rRNA factor 2 n=1 Tax=Multifurca ochricompacta TaxID=376703 RepID=A0AAD4M4N9_9AGAM|nr:hypothetical protein B0F90DRAFT_1715832 [Multifurca ochricompacta]